MLNYRMWGAPRMLNYRNEDAPWWLSCRILDASKMENYPGRTLNFKRLKPGCTPCKSHKPGCIKLWNFLIFFHTFLFCFVLCMVTESQMGPEKKHVDIKRCNTPNFYDTYHTFMILYCIVMTTCFTRSVQQKIKAPVKVNPCPAFCFLIGQDCCTLTSQYLAEQARGCMNIRHALCSDKVPIFFFFQMWFDSFLLLFFFFFFFCLFFVVVFNITVFHVSVALSCIPITPISTDIFLKVLELLPFKDLESCKTRVIYPFQGLESGVHVCIATTAKV